MSGEANKPSDGKGERMSQPLMCRCGCESEAEFLCDGTDFDGSKFTDEPACIGATIYMESSAWEFELPFSKRPITQTKP